MKVISLAVLCGIVIVACGAPPAPRMNIPSQTIDKPFDVTWTAVAEALVRSSLAIKDANKETGLITSGWLPTEGYNLNCGTFSVDRSRMEHHVKISVLLKKVTDASTEVKLDCRFRLVAVSQSHSKTTACDSTGRLEKEIYERILEQVR